MFTMWPTKPTPGLRAQLDIGPQNNRLPAYRSITAPVLVIGFGDDVVLPAASGPRGRRGAAERPLPGDSRRRPSGLHRKTAGRERGGPGILRRIGCSGEPIDGTGPCRRRRTDSRRRPRRRAVPGIAERAAGLRAARRRPRRPDPAARPHRRAHRRLPGDRPGGGRGSAGVCGDDVGHRGGQPRARGGGGQLRAGAADRAVGQPALRAAGHRREPDDGAAGLLRHAGAGQHQPRACRRRARADGLAQRAVAVGDVPSVGGGHGFSHRERRAGAVRHPAARAAGARSRLRPIPRSPTRRRAGRAASRGRTPRR